MVRAVSCCVVLLQVALKALSLKGIKDWKQLELFQREAVVLQVSGMRIWSGLG